MKLDLGSLHECTLPFDAGMALYPGDPAPIVTTTQDAGYRYTAVQTRLHTGTHVDAPAHFLPHRATIDQFGPFVGKGVVVDGKVDRGAVVSVDMKGIDPGTHVLVRTAKNTQNILCRFDPTYEWLHVDVARALVAHKVGSVSFDAYSVDPFDEGSVGGGAHVVFAEANVCVFVNVVMRALKPGPCAFIGAPWLVRNAEGAPARVWVGQRRPGRGRSGRAL